MLQCKQGTSPGASPATATERRQSSAPSSRISLPWLRPGLAPSQLERQDVVRREVEALAQYLAHVVLGEAPGNGARIAPVVQHLAHLQAQGLGVPGVEGGARVGGWVSGRPRGWGCR